jgi:hypothetical protein
MSAALPFVLAAMNSLVPHVDHSELGGAIARRVDAERPLFAGDEDKRKTASVLIAIAYRESSLRLDAVGDKGTSFCALQIHRSSGGMPAMLTDASLCVGRAFEILRTSIRVCRAHPIAFYAEGPRGCSSPRAQRISRDRMAIAAGLRARVVVPAAEVYTTGHQGFRSSSGAIPCCVTGRRSGAEERVSLPCVSLVLGGAS